jgi:hypothetical protein
VPDQDGVVNLDEFFDNTNPNDADPTHDPAWAAANSTVPSFRPRLIAYSDPGGSVTVTPMKLSYDLGESVTLTATPSAPSVFVGWTGGYSG